MKTHTQRTVTKEGKETRGRVANEVRDDWWSVKHDVRDAGVVSQMKAKTPREVLCLMLNPRGSVIQEFNKAWEQVTKELPPTVKLHSAGTYFFP